SGYFFQAEDGIRDKLVTGVQTCALPISDSSAAGGDGFLGVLLSLSALERLLAPVSLQKSDASDERGKQRGDADHHPGGAGWTERSEERRVGKEGRAGCEGQREKRRVEAA